MKINCASCGKFVAEIQPGSHIRKGAVMVCLNCHERFKIADEMARMARSQASSADLPEFFQDVFGKNGFKK